MTRVMVLTRMTVYGTCTVSRRGTSSAVDCGSPVVVDQSSSAPRRVQRHQQTMNAARLHDIQMQYVTNQPPKANSAFHPSGVVK